jgi:hypothetical protein
MHNPSFTTARTCCSGVISGWLVTKSGSWGKCWNEILELCGTWLQTLVPNQVTVINGVLSSRNSQSNQTCGGRVCPSDPIKDSEVPITHIALFLVSTIHLTKYVSRYRSRWNSLPSPLSLQSLLCACWLHSGPPCAGATLSSSMLHWWQHHLYHSLQVRCTFLLLLLINETKSRFITRISLVYTSHTPWIYLTRPHPETEPSCVLEILMKGKDIFELTKIFLFRNHVHGIYRVYFWNMLVYWESIYSVYTSGWFLPGFELSKQWGFQMLSSQWTKESPIPTTCMEMFCLATVRSTFTARYISKVGGAYIWPIWKICTLHYFAWWFGGLHIILHIEFGVYNFTHICKIICTNMQNDM